MATVEPIRKRKLWEPAEPPQRERKEGKKPNNRKAEVSDFMLRALNDIALEWEAQGQAEGYILRPMATESNARSWASGIRKGKIRVRGGVILSHVFLTDYNQRSDGKWYVWARCTGRREQ